MITSFCCVFVSVVLAVHGSHSLTEAFPCEDCQAWALLEQAERNIFETESNDRDELHAKEKLLLQIAAVYASGGKTERARAVAARITWPTTKRKAAATIARNLVRTGEYEEARKILREAVEISDEAVNSILTRLITDVCKTREDAVRHIRFLNKDESIPPAIVYLLTGDIKRGVDAFLLESGQELDPADIARAESLARSLIEEGFVDTAKRFLTTVFDNDPLQIQFRLAIDLARSGRAVAAYQVIAQFDDSADRKIAGRYVSNTLQARADRAKAVNNLDTGLHYELGDAPTEWRQVIELADIESHRGHYEAAKRMLDRVYEKLISLKITGSRSDLTSTLVQSYSLSLLLAHAQARSRDVSGALRTTTFIGSTYGSATRVNIIRDIAAQLDRGDQLTGVLTFFEDDPLSQAYARFGAAAAKLDYPLEMLSDKDPVEGFEAIIVMNYANALHIAADPSKDDVSRVFAVQLVANAVPAEMAIPVLVNALTTGHDSTLRRQAVLGLTKCDTFSTDSNEAVVYAIRNDSIRVQIAAARYLVKFRQHNEDLVRFLKQLLRDGNSAHLCIAADLIGDTGAAGSFLLTNLVDVADEKKDPRVCLYAARAVWKIRESAPLPLLEFALLDTHDPWVAAKAAETLGEIGTSESLAILRKAQVREDDYFRLHLALAIWRITGDSEEPRRIILSVLMKDSLSCYIAASARKALDQLGDFSNGQ